MVGKYSFLNRSAASPKSLLTSASMILPSKMVLTDWRIGCLSKSCIISITSTTNTNVLTFENRFCIW